MGGGSGGDGVTTRTTEAVRGRGRRHADTAVQGQLTLPLGPVVNREFLSNHWLEHRLPCAVRPRGRRYTSTLRLTKRQKREARKPFTRGWTVSASSAARHKITTAA